MHLFDSALNSSSIFKRHKAKAPVAVCVPLQHYLQEEIIMNGYWKYIYMTKKALNKWEEDKYQQIYGPETSSAPATVK
jgi:hypothetical protein